MAYKITDDCIACGACADSCPMGAIVEGGPGYMITGDCIDCGACTDSCPMGAIVEG
ncbi:MAG: 4Fe-4S binding protein [Firmicutes bacterium]|jgi:formate hydrogenlyase subunit 6/NADH:ubiquinone oxidoreductase subunit I|nr:4Fe-4S binding protein [Bacillota bacterium]